MQRYPAKYSDTRGEEVTTIHNDGETLRMTVRGVDFDGCTFAGLEPSTTTTPHQLQTFSISARGDLCNCQIECEIPIKIQAQEEIAASLRMKLEMGKPADRGWRDKEILSLSLQYDNHEFHSEGRDDRFEEELLDLQKQLPPGHHLKCCFGCAFSDYSPYGNGQLGMLCFRNTKEQYLAVTSKGDYWPVFAQAAGQVQEIYLCPEFEVRPPNIGYRG